MPPSSTISKPDPRQRPPDGREPPDLVGEDVVRPIEAVVFGAKDGDGRDRLGLPIRIVELDMRERSIAAGLEARASAPRRTRGGAGS